MPAGENQRRKHGCTGVNATGKNGLECFDQRVRAGHVARRGDFEFARVIILHGFVRCHRYETALRVARKEQFSGIASADFAECLSGCTQRVNHVIGLLLRQQIRVIGRTRCVVADVVGGDHDPALSGVHRSNQARFAVRGARDVVVLLNSGAVAIEQHGASTGAGRIGTRGHHDAARGVGGLVRAADRVVFHVVKIDTALRGASQLKQTATTGRC